MKRAFFCTLCLVCALPAYSETTYAPVANVGYVLDTLAQKYQDKFGSRIILSGGANNQQIANMEYLLGTIDKINNHAGTATQYAQSQQATQQAINTNAVDIAFDTLIKSPYKFSVTVNDTNSFAFKMHASGLFVVDCGEDGIANSYHGNRYEFLINNAASETNITCEWPDSGEHTIRLSGQATGYSNVETTDENGSTVPAHPTISFQGNKKLSKISGGLGKIFSTLSDGTQPNFYKTFASTSITTIPEDLFSTLDANGNVIEGINGSPGKNMFSHTFDSSNITGELPINLFAGVSGSPAPRMFFATFYGTKNLTGIKGTKNHGLFTRINGKMAQEMYRATFQASGINSIPENLFGYTNFYINSCSNPVDNGTTIPNCSAFYQTFDNATNLTSASTKMLQSPTNPLRMYMYEISDYLNQNGTYMSWNNRSVQPNLLYMYGNTNVSDKGKLLSNWK